MFDGDTLHEQIAAVIGATPRSIAPLSGGCVGEVYRVTLLDNTSLVAKLDRSASPRLACEGRMLRYLAEHSHLPVPAVLHSSESLLLMEYLAGESHFPLAVQRHAAELLADLHAISESRGFGFEEDTLIGGLPQPNPWAVSWIEFFRDQRLMHMGAEAVRAGRMPHTLLGRLERFVAHLDEWLEEPVCSSLIHGDVWTTNVLARNGRVTGFIDPAIYYAHAEIELAFTTLFGTFDEDFLRRYEELRPIAPGFMEVRRDIYNLYPLLVHVRLFGGGYVASVESILHRFGF